MLLKFSKHGIRSAAPAHVRQKIAFLAGAVLLLAAVDVTGRDGSKDWTVLENCRFILNPADDGDSFHVSVDSKEYIFRLYMIDAPETDEMNPTRIAEQAKYFGITAPQVIEAGQAAKEFTRERLSQPFTVFTRFSGAMGRSKLERFYAFVQIKDGDLGEQLVRAGLARSYGFKAAPPGSKNSRPELEKLQQFEDEARREKIGGWGVNAGRLNVRAQRSAAFSVFVVEKNVRQHGAPLAKTSSQILETPVPEPVAAAVSPTEVKNSHAKDKTPLGKIDINTATEKELRSVPGIGPVTATRIIAARPFRSADDLKKVNGIGDKSYAKLRPYFQ